MLQFHTIEPATLDLLKKISSHPVFFNHRLVGGTSLALQFGHRLSIDLDLFSSLETDFEEILMTISSFGRVEVVSRSAFIHCFFINDIKVDFVSLPYAWIDDPVKHDSPICRANPFAWHCHSRANPFARYPTFLLFPMLETMCYLC